MNKFNFRPYTEAEADRFVKEFPIIQPIRHWVVQFQDRWNKSNPSENWTARTYRKSENEPSPFFSLERDLSVVGGYDKDFLLAEIDGLDISNQAATEMLLHLRNHYRENAKQREAKLGQVVGRIDFTTEISARTNRVGDLVYYGCSWGNDGDFFKREMAKFT